MIKRVSCAILAMCFVILLIPVNALAGPVSYDFDINDAGDFADFCLLVEGGHDDFDGKTVGLKKDIVLPADWKPIGWHNGKMSNGSYYRYEDCDPFKGTFYGDGHTITLPATSSDTYPYTTSDGRKFSFIALFSRNKGTIQDLTVAGGPLANTLNGVGSYPAYIAGIASYNSGTVKNCHSTIVFNGNSDENSSQLAGIVAENAAGGVVEDCSFTGESKGGGLFKAGIVARNFGTVKRCFSNATIAYGKQNGGIVSMNHSPGIVDECCFTGKLLNGSQLSGIAYGNQSIITHCLFSGELSGNFLASLVCRNDSTASIVSSYSTSAEQLVWRNNGAITDCYYDKQVNTAASQPGTGLDTVQMTQLTALDAGNMANLGGSAIWTVKANDVNTNDVMLYYPQLKHFADKGHNFPKTTGYRLSFDANGGSGSVAPITQRLGEPITVPDSTGITPSAGASFVGWNTSADGNGTDYAVGGSFTAGANSTLYAKWSVIVTPSPVPTPAPPPPPKTGDSSQPLVWLGLCLLTVSGLTLLALRRRRV